MIPAEPPQCYLASSSPRRMQLLQQLGISFQVVRIDVNEIQGPGESAQDYVMRVALDKARAGWNSPERLHECPVLGADTEVVLGDQVFGKPRDREHAIDMLGRLSGTCHQVLSGVAMVQGEREDVVLNTNQVCFRALTEAEIRAYWNTGEPDGKAGAYAIQGRAAMFISHLEGSFSGVMGLPLFETAELFTAFDVSMLKYQ